MPTRWVSHSARKEMWGEPPSSLLSGPWQLWWPQMSRVTLPINLWFLWKFTQIQYMWICGDSCELGEDLVVTAGEVHTLKGAHLQRQLARWTFTFFRGFNGWTSFGTRQVPTSCWSQSIAGGYRNGGECNNGGRVKLHICVGPEARKMMENGQMLLG